MGVIGISAVLAAQQLPAPQSTFRTGVDVVQVDVSVLDRNRNPVTGLTAADFTVRVDGKPVPLAAFTAVNLTPRVARGPSAPAWLDEVAPDVATSNVPREGRLVVILFDQTVKSIQQPAARQIALGAVDALGPDDLAAVVHVLGGTPQNFTRDRARLRAAINSPFIGLGDGEEWANSNPLTRTTPLSQSANRNSPTQGNCTSGSCSLDAVTRIAESLRDAPRRKMLLFITTGPSIQPRLPGVRNDDTQVAREKLFRALEVANLTIHVLDPTGLETLTFRPRSKP
jgi:VWFA-related protein